MWAMILVNNVILDDFVMTHESRFTLRKSFWVCSIISRRFKISLKLLGKICCESFSSSTSFVLKRDFCRIWRNVNSTNHFQRLFLLLKLEKWVKFRRYDLWVFFTVTDWQSECWYSCYPENGNFKRSDDSFLRYALIILCVSGWLERDVCSYLVSKCFFLSTWAYHSKVRRFFRYRGADGVIYEWCLNKYIPKIVSPQRFCYFFQWRDGKTKNPQFIKK